VFLKFLAQLLVAQQQLRERCQAVLLGDTFRGQLMQFNFPLQIRPQELLPLMELLLLPVKLELVLLCLEQLLLQLLPGRHGSWVLRVPG
jgi:hypothetical protein